ncbi:TetR family transcriptional regulator [Herbidospora galbida]|uniref:TetR family transcriptional regulator n=1 Tax=Herbidospora galbida TaxID=2575442 RepID=A0A4U3MSS2_9ACTN|nr:TetR/AcrR family transcriptional regulator [Herbidospora galbida]TKK91416.1 TetR family transcriptional regulator [Herbidospora galbida]
MPRTKNATSRDTKQRIADAAIDQFHRKGYNGTSVQDLVTAAGAPKGTFYNHYSSKEELAVEAVRRYGEGFGLAALEDRTTGTARERVDRHLTALIASGLEVAAERGCMMANLAGEVPAHSEAVAAAIGAHLDRWSASLATAIEEAKAAGDYTTALDSRDLATFIVSAWEGGAVRSKTTSSAEPLRTFERMVAQLLR